MMKRLKSATKWIWQLGDVPLPIGRPWFARPQRYLRMWWPIAWQGWLVASALVLWLAASAVFFLWSGWEPSNHLLYGWFFPTFGFGSLIVGAKTDPRAKEDRRSR